MLAATAIAIFFIPAFYLIITELAERYKSKRAAKRYVRRPQPPAPQPPENPHA